jgi:tRNA modification GTPase
MSRSYLDTETPIAALATHPGRAAIAVVRCSGKGAIDLCAPCFSRPKALLGAQTHRLVHGYVVHPGTGEKIDQVLLAVFRSPQSYTGEDSVEFQCHGSAAIVSSLLSLLEHIGFAPALPGEFSFRAFINGKTDLVEAEAVNELSGALCEAARKDALDRLAGILSSQLGKIRASLIDVAAEIEARLDYPEEEGPDSDPPSSLPYLAKLAVAKAELDSLSASYAAGRLRQEGVLVVVAGKPNAGKSSLFNLIVREERAIVSPEPGTTRDWLEAWIEMGGFAIRLVDTAGLRDAVGDIEAQGVKRSLNLAQTADVLLYMVDGRSGLAEEDREFLAAYPRAIRIWNKIDAKDCAPALEGWIPLSAKRVESLGVLESLVVRAIGATTSGMDREGAVRIASARQKILVDRARESIAAAHRGVEKGDTLDLAALDLKDAMDAIGEITGDIVTDEVFDRIFGSFCLGK